MSRHDWQVDGDTFHLSSTHRLASVIHQADHSRNVVVLSEDGEDIVRVVVPYGYLQDAFRLGETWATKGQTQ